ncbi:MAG: LptF/LptG family permease [Fimbriimonadaceae bacterium]|nr:LptF/LptG family permease [Chitinophagales bacterium]
MIKKIDKYIIKSFIGPFFVTFFIALFILLIQFLWKYIDDLVGKGLEWFIIAKLLFYASANLIPLALPLATLLSSIMTYGNLGERFELAAFKSAGISMFRFMRSTILIGVFITIGAFLFSNYILPTASLKFWSTLLDITKQKPALNIKPNEFYNEIEHYTILIGDKAEDNISIKDITIYEEIKGQSNSVVIADHGEMLPSTDKENLVMKLYDGKQYEEMRSQQKSTKTKEHMRMHFGEWEKALDITGFQMTETGESLYSDHYKMMNVEQLTRAIDSLARQARSKSGSAEKLVKPYFYFTKDSAYVFSDSTDTNYSESFLKLVPPNEKKMVISGALTSSRAISAHTTQIEQSLKSSNNRIIEHKVEVHRKITLSLACLVFLFVGAPLGAIIRKGGFGFPVIFSILIFIFFYVINISGERMADQSAITVFAGMWMAILIIFPISIFLTIKAKNDAPIVNSDSYATVFRRIRNFFIKKSDAAN